MGKVTDELVALISRQVQDHGLVVWYDPQGVYRDVVAELDLPATHLLRFEGSFFELRSRLEPLLEFVNDDGSFHPDLETPPRGVVYVPRDRAATEHALVEAEAAGVVMEPGASPWQRNTRLKVLAERVFKRIAPDRAAAVAAEVEAGRRTLAELDWLADQTGDFGAVKLIFGTTALPDVLLAFATSDRHDAAIIEKQSLAELCQLTATELGVRVGAGQPVSQARNELCRSLLLAELALRVESAGHDLPALESVPRPETARQQHQLMAVCSQWRNRLDLRDSYVQIARRVENEAQVLALGLRGEMLAEVETFCCLESILLDAVEARILAGDWAEARHTARRRRTSFWSLCEGDVQLRWTLLEIAASMLLAAGRVETELKSIPREPAALIDAYVNGVPRSDGDPMPWCLMDRHQRHLEHRYAMIELDGSGRHDQLVAVVRHARQRYFDVAHRCAEVLGNALESVGFQAAGIARQRDVFLSQVRTSASEQKTAYLLIDALRYEMAMELVEGLGDDFSVALAPAVVQLPSITEVGMAALMPGAEKEMELVDVGAGRVGVRIGDTVLKDRTSHWKHFQHSLGGKAALLKLNDLMKPTKKQRDDIEAAEMLLVTSQEVDRRGEETSDEEEARLFMAEVLEKVRRGIRRLAALRVKEIIVAADHGHVFVEDVDESMKMDAPGGETVDLHPRVWVGRGGAAHDRYLRVTAGRLGMAGDLELVFPRGLACLRSRGSGGGYFHGGISLQEVVVPVAAIRVSKPPAQGVGTTSVTLTVAKPKITTRFFSVEAKYVVAGLFGEDSKRVKVIVRSSRKDVGMAAMAAYGFEEGTQEIVLEKDRPNAITVMLTDDVDGPAVSVHVLDAVTQVELAAIKAIPVEISM